MPYPYLARTTLKYKSPHATDLSFAKDETIRVTGPSADDEDWLVGENLDGSKSGGFPKDFITPIDEPEAETPATEADTVPDVVVATASDPSPVSDVTPVRALSPPAPAPAAPSAPAPPAAPSPVPAAPPVQAPADDPDSPAKPQSMKDRLAFFTAAQTKAGPPPPVKPKPATSGLTWSQRQKLRQEQEAKEGGTSAPAPTHALAATAPVAHAEPKPVPAADEESRMSAADAQSSISKGGSLRERMAALQGAGAFGQPEEKSVPSKPSGKVWHRPVAPEPEQETDDAPAESPSVEKGEAEVSETPQDTEEDEEKAKRAAIAARMAKLGARGPMGMAAPPKPARKPTQPAQEAHSAAAIPTSAPSAATQHDQATSEAPAQESPATSPPVSIPIAAIPRRTAPPRRKPARQQSGVQSPPPQIMVADEEKPLPKTEEQLLQEQEHEEAGAGPGGAAGATAAGIALMPALNDGQVAGPPAASGDIVDDRESEPQELEDGLVEGGAEKDDVMEAAQQGNLDYKPPADPIDGAEPKLLGTIPLQPPADDTSEVAEESEELDEVPPPPPRTRGFMKDEVEMKHQREAEDAEAVEPEDEAPPVPVRPEGRALHPGHDRALPPPPPGNPMIPPRDNEEEREAEGLADEPIIEEPEDMTQSGESEGEDDEEGPPPPPRKPTMPSIVTVPSAASPPQPPANVSPTVPLSPKPTSPPASAAADEAAEDASRRKGIAARMAKLGGIKFGMPPPVRKQSSRSPAPPQSPLDEGSPVEVPMSPMEVPNSPVEATIPEEGSPAAAAPPMGVEDETPDQEAARRRATLARLKAGGALGFGMFSNDPTSPTAADERGLEEQIEPEAQPIEEEQEAPPPPPPGRAAPSQRTSLPPPNDEAPPPPPPPPPGRPATSKRTSLPPPPADEGGARSMVQQSPRQSFPPPPEDVSPPVRATQAPTSPVPMSPSTSNRPPVPVSEKRYSQQPSVPTMQEEAPVPSQSFDSQLVHEPAVMMMAQQSPIAPPLPPISTRPPAPAPASESPRRSMSAASPRMTTAESPVLGQGSPTSRQPSRQESQLMPKPSMDQPRPSMGQGRPGYEQLVAASRDGGARLARAARAIFDQGKKGYYGDGSAASFVLIAMEQAQLPRPSTEWGQVVFEQEGSSVMKRYDEPRPGDIAAFYDAKLKGKKGLTSYNQHVGSVEEPLVGVVLEFESKHKQKMRVLQVERGVPEEVSYRCEDLKSGRIVMYRVGL